VLYNSSVIGDIYADFERTAAVSELITAEACEKRSVYKKIAGAILNIFAPLL
jgi:cardiolipin synthase